MNQMNRQRNKGRKEASKADDDTVPNWKVKCEICDEVPTVGSTGLCGPCCFGEAETAGGNW